MADLVERLRELESKEGVCGQSDVRRFAFRDAANQIESSDKRLKAVAALVSVWRDEGIRLNGGADKPYTDSENSIRALTLGWCSDELQQAIAASQEPSHG